MSIQNSNAFIDEIIQTKKLNKEFSKLKLNDLVEILAKEIFFRKLKLIKIVGGVASGKSTLANKLKNKLEDVIIISTDDYVKGTREWRRDEIVSKNKSPLEKYDIQLLNEVIINLLSHDFIPVRIPKYNELTGLAVANSIENYILIDKKPEFVIVEGDFQFITKRGLQIYLHLSDEARSKLRIDRDTKNRGEIDLKKLVSDIATRNAQQHYPFTLPEAANSEILIITSVINNIFTYDLYL